MSPIYPVMIGWSILAPVLFRVLGPQRGLAVVLFGGWAFLPVADFPASYGESVQLWLPPIVLPGPHLMTRALVLGAAVLLGAATCGGGLIRKYRPHYLDAVVVGFCLVPIASGLRNDLPVSDYLAQTGYLLLAYLAPWLVVRAAVTNLEEALTVLRGLVYVGVVTAVLAVPELIFGPIWYPLIYGAHPYLNAGISRYVGFRPVMFAEDGNQYGMWMATVGVLAVGLWWLGRRRGDGSTKRMGAAAVILLAAGLAAQSVGAILLTVGGVGLIAVLRIVPSRIVLAVICLPIVLYVGGMAMGLVSAKQIAETPAGQALEEILRKTRRSSFAWRMAWEERHLGTVKRRPVVGHGRWDWWRQSRPNATRPWSLWMTAAGLYGAIGAGLLFLTLAGPMIVLMIRLGRPAMHTSEASLGLVCGTVVGINVADGFLNTALIICVVALSAIIVSTSLQTSRATASGAASQPSA